MEEETGSIGHDNEEPECREEQLVWFKFYVQFFTLSTWLMNGEIR